LTVGTMQKRKGQDTMIRALPAVRKTCPEVLYVVAGPGLERGYLNSIARECGVEDLVQFREDASEQELVTCYQQCDVFALPNRQIGWDVEGFGMVLLEAQACGKPVIAGNSGGTLDTLQDGITGLLIDATMPDHVAQTVTQMLTEVDLDAMGERARRWVLERFDWETLVREALGIFNTEPPADNQVQVA
jgi:phosphatidylinositol alpha-1,6-mannosyltransferase